MLPFMGKQVLKVLGRKANAEGKVWGGGTGTGVGVYSRQCGQNHGVQESSETRPFPTPPLNQTPFSRAFSSPKYYTVV